MTVLILGRKQLKVRESICFYLCNRAQEHCEVGLSLASAALSTEQTFSLPLEVRCDSCGVVRLSVCRFISFTSQLENEITVRVDAVFDIITDTN